MARHRHATLHPQTEEQRMVGTEQRALPPLGAARSNATCRTSRTARHVGAWLCHCPDILASFQANPQVWTNFLAMSPLYQHVRIDTIQRDRSDMNRFNARIQRLIDSAAQGKLIGEWHDHGRLLEI